MEGDRPEGDWSIWRDDGLVLRSGGLVDPESLPRFEQLACSVLRDLIVETRDLHSQSNYSDRFDRLSVFYVRNSSANALAIERGDRRGVAIYIGLLWRLWAAFQIGLSRREFLEGAFDTPPLQLSASPSLLLLRSEQLASVPEAFWPEERRLALWDLFQRSLLFLLCHELAHHARGHLDLVHDKLGMDGIDELASAAGDGLDQCLLRMIEFDADTDALDMILLADTAEAKRENWSVDKSEAQGFQWLVSIATLFLAFDLDHKSVADQYRGSHPAPVHRAVHAVSTMARSYAFHFGWSEEKRIFYEEEAWEAAGIIAEAVGMPEGRWFGESTVLMDLDRYAEEEARFLEFNAWLTSEVTNGDVEEPAWLTEIGRPGSPQRP